MANQILHKRKTTTGAGAGALTQGELGLNVFDGQVYMFQTDTVNANVIVGTPPPLLVRALQLQPARQH